MSFSNNLNLVEPRIGTGKRGNCLIGPCLPFSLVRLGPDIVYPQPNSGYLLGKPLIGFSHTRLGGTGGAARYGNVRIMPFIGEPRRLLAPPFISFPATDRRWSKPLEEHAEVGRYGCRFAYGVEVELTSTRHTGVHRYRFTRPGRRCVLVDFASILQNASAPAGEVPFCEDWELEQSSLGGMATAEAGGELAGRSDLRGGWGHFEAYSVFFFLRSRGPFTSCEFYGAEGPLSGASAEGKGLRALLTYPETCDEIDLEVGISFSSVENARAAVDTESAGQPIEVVTQQARAAWTPWLDLVQARGGSPDEHALLATSLYHLFTQPTDLSGDGQPNALTDIVCLWDSIRNANSLFHLIAPEFSAVLMNSLLGHADLTGWLPDAHVAGHAAFQQSGCCAEILFSEAARKGIPGVDYQRALAACVRNAETVSPDPYRFGRYLDEYESLGYLSTRIHKGCVSRHIEYTYQDWCIARLAETLGEPATAARFDARADRLWNIWRDDKKSFWPRHPDGAWADHPSADLMQWDSWNDPYTYEGSLLHWSLSGLHDIAGLIQRHGGGDSFAAYLDAYFQKHGDIEKETRMHIPHLYQFVGQPQRTAAVIRHSLATRYAVSPDGIPDNEDMGCHSAYYICNAMGLYPIYGQTFYSVLPPLFPELLVTYGRTGKSLRIVRYGPNTSIRHVRLNGREMPGTLLEHREIAEGGLLEIETVAE